MSIVVAGLSHHSAPLTILERTALSEDSVAKLLADVYSADELSEAVVVATCNRLELYVDAATFHGAVDEITALLSLHTGMDKHLLAPHLYVYYGDRAVAHLFHTVSGVDSMVIGEPQVLGQVRTAFAQAQDAGVVGRTLSELFQAALRVGKRVRTSSGIEAVGRSLVSFALEKVGVEVEGKQALVIGAGSLASLAVKTLREAGAIVTVANRTVEKAGRLVSDAGQAIAISDIPTVLATMDLVVSGTGAVDVVLSYDDVARAVAQRTRPLTIIDLALPHDVDPEVNKLQDVTLANLAYLNQVKDTVRGGSYVSDAVMAARKLIAEEVADYASLQRATQVAPTVVALRAMADNVVDAELARMSGRLPDIDDRTRSVVVATVRRVVDKLLHSPTVRVKELADRPDGEAYEAALRELFALDKRVVDAVVLPDQVNEEPAMQGQGEDAK